MIAEVIGLDDSITATPTITAASAYASGNRFGSIMNLTSAFRNIFRDIDTQTTQNPAGPGPKSIGKVYLTSILTSDKNNTNSAFDFIFFSSSPTIASADKAALSIATTEITKIIGTVSCSFTYTAATSFSIAEAANLNILMKQAAAAADQSIYCLAVIKSASTFASTTDVSFTFKFMQD